MENDPPGGKQQAVLDAAGQAGGPGQGPQQGEKEEEEAEMTGLTHLSLFTGIEGGMRR